MWVEARELLEVVIHGKTGEYVIPGPTVKGMPKKRRSRGMAAPPKGGYRAKDVPEEPPMPAQPATPRPKGKRSQQQIRAYPEAYDKLEVGPISMLGQSIHKTTVTVPNYGGVTKKRSFIKGVDWALEKLAVVPKKELDAQERDFAANTRNMKGGSPLGAAIRFNRMPGSALTFQYIRSPLRIVTDKMDQVSKRKAGSVKMINDPFWYGVSEVGLALTRAMDYDKESEWTVKEIKRLWLKHTPLEVDDATGKVQPKGWKLGPPPEINEQTYHGRDGKFTSAHGARTVTRNGERFKMVRQLRKMKGARTRSKRRQEEGVFDIFGQPDAERAVSSLLTAPPGWVPVDAFFEGPLIER